MQDHSAQLQEEELEKNFEDNRDLILKILVEMKTSLPFEDELLKQTQVVFLREWKEEDWNKLARRFTNIISKQSERHFNAEMKRMAINFKGLSLEHEKSQKTILETWNHLFKKYPEMARLAMAVLVLPSSTVSVERVFSNMKDIKTSKRNRLNVDNLETCLLIYNSYKTLDFDITNEMDQKFKDLWKKEKEIESKDYKTMEEAKKDETLPDEDKKPESQKKIQRFKFLSPKDYPFLFSDQ